jgi:hypothetical protein
VEFVARPQPDPEQEEALSLALERLLARDVRPPAYGSLWRVAGIAENLGAEGREAPARPRNAAE